MSEKGEGGNDEPVLHGTLVKESDHCITILTVSILSLWTATP